MLTILSPAKSLDLSSPVPDIGYSQPQFLGDARKLVRELKKLDAQELSGLMHMSASLGELNQERFAAWRLTRNSDNARPAIFTFSGDVYLGLKARDLAEDDLAWAQRHLRILSGLYGLLRPLDLIQAYRLEMGTRFENPGGKDLYQFWGQKLTRALNRELRQDDASVLVNLASNEYFNVVQPDDIKGDIITPVFKDFSSGKYRFLSFFAKQARGMMASYIVRHRIQTPAELKDFSTAGYRYSESESSSNRLVFLRKKPVPADAS